LTHDATPLSWPDPDLSVLLIAVVLVLAPLAVLVSHSFIMVMQSARPSRPVTSWVLIPAIGGAGLLIGICSLWFPELPGNGKSILTVTLNSDLTIAGAAAILLLKPALTAVYLRAGAVGGLLTPSLATGAALGSLVAIAVNTWTDWSLSVPAVSLACAAAVLAITQRSPLWAALFVWELARPPWWILIVFAVAALGAYWLHALWFDKRRSRPSPT
jgi:H+/Cl- antiporter ClcA